MSTEARRPPLPDDAPPPSPPSRITDALVPPEQPPRTLRPSGITEVFAPTPGARAEVFAPPATPNGSGDSPPPSPTAPRSPQGDGPGEQPPPGFAAPPAGSGSAPGSGGAGSPPPGRARSASGDARPQDDADGPGPTGPVPPPPRMAPAAEERAVPPRPSGPPDVDTRSLRRDAARAGLPTPPRPLAPPSQAPTPGGPGPETPAHPARPAGDRGRNVPPRPDAPPGRPGAGEPWHRADADGPRRVSGLPPRPHVPPLRTGQASSTVPRPRGAGPRRPGVPTKAAGPEWARREGPRPPGSTESATITETTTLLRPVGVPLHRSGPGSGSGPGGAYSGGPPWPPPESPSETTTRLRPFRDRHPLRTAGVIACAVLGLGLIGGAATGTWLTEDSNAHSTDRTAYSEARSVWHSTPVDTLFPRTLSGRGAGPGRADREWTRIAVAPDSGCAPALDPLLVTTLRPVGCARVLRATYRDATSSHVTTVGMVFTVADAAAMRALNTRFTAEGLAGRRDLMPRAFPVAGTAAAGFGDRQRASWTVKVRTDAPVVVYAVSGFADGRRVTDPQPAGATLTKGATSAPAQSGLGHEARGIADSVERALDTTLGAATEPSR
ncbi:hypothetical protein ACWF94_07600 [Streptomyces sp. NPDC055078]